jgi:3-isopropylmalate/(R)-2-methylmalate dehydratase small subunit
VKPFTRVEATAAPLMIANIDTDQIIRIDRLIEHRRGELGPFCLEALRYQADGSENPNFVPGSARYRGAAILVAAENFGCGSSREHAPIALGSANCKVVLAESFARIFFRNSVATGELYPCECLDRLSVLLKTGDVVTVDLDAATVKAHATGQVYSFKALGDVRPVVDAGGLFNYARKTGMMPAQAPA